MNSNITTSETNEDYRVRVIKEHDDLEAKLTRLVEFANTDFFKGLDKEEQQRLRNQAFHMQDYLDALKERITAFGD